MGNLSHLDRLKMGAVQWIEWRRENPDLEPDLSHADLSGANLRGASLQGVNLRKAHLEGTKLIAADLRRCESQ